VVVVAVTVVAVTVVAVVVVVLIVIVVVLVAVTLVTVEEVVEHPFHTEARVEMLKRRRSNPSVMSSHSDLNTVTNPCKQKNRRVVS
jgi:hypothetical protein